MIVHAYQLLNLVVATEVVDYHLLLADLIKFAVKRTVVVLASSG